MRPRQPGGRSAGVVERGGFGRFPPALLPAACALLLATGCSSFNRDWDAAGRDVRAGGNAARAIEGRWEGTWRSDVNAHTDQLRCLVKPSTNGTFSARFQAKYRKLIRLTFTYSVPLTVTNQDDAWHFEGTANLGWYAGGRYVYRGRATATNFFSHYECPQDKGVFEMTRPREDSVGTSGNQP